MASSRPGAPLPGDSHFRRMSAQMLRHSFPNEGYERIPAEVRHRKTSLLSSANGVSYVALRGALERRLLASEIPRTNRIILPKRILYPLNLRWEPAHS